MGIFDWSEGTGVMIRSGVCRQSPDRSGLRLGRLFSRDKFLPIWA